MAALTPTDAKSSIINVIEIFDSDDKPNVTQNLPPDKQVSGNISVSTCSAAEKGENFDTNYAQNNNENLGFGEDVLFSVTPKRKNTCNVVLTDDEDDDVPISQLTRRKVVTQHCLQSPSRSQDNKKSSCTPYKDDDDDMHTQKVCVDKIVSDDDMPISQLTRIKKVTWHRLQPLRNCENKSQDDKKSPCRPYKVNKLQQTIPTTNVDADDESEEELSYSEGGNMGGFIVDDSDISSSEDTSNNSLDGSNAEEDSDSSNSQDKEDNSKVSYSQDVSGRDMDFGMVLFYLTWSCGVCIEYIILAFFFYYISIFLLQHVLQEKTERTLTTVAPKTMRKNWILAKTSYFLKPARGSGLVMLF